MVKEMSNQEARMPSLASGEGRTARYLRISITDRCNLNCVYCRDPRRESHIPHDDILRYEEIFRLARIMRGLGIGKFRVTGGEPFMRKNCMSFLADLRKDFPDSLLCFTSNGTLLEPYIEDIARIKPQSVNISLDSFRSETFRKVTGADLLARVLANIDNLLCRDVKVKLNAVAMKGVTDVEIDDFIHAAREMPLEIRFIEFMPMGGNTIWKPEMCLSAKDIKSLVARKAGLVPVQDGDKLFSGPARMFAIPGAKGRIGFISAMSDHFCSSCNRLRITSNGSLRTCLFSDREYRLAPLLRHQGVRDETIARIVMGASRAKPRGDCILGARKGVAVAEKAMSGIGG